RDCADGRTLLPRGLDPRLADRADHHDHDLHPRHRRGDDASREALRRRRRRAAPGAAFHHPHCRAIPGEKGGGKRAAAAAAAAARGLAGGFIVKWRPSANVITLASTILVCALLYAAASWR